jgi:hypothetical protein
MKDFSQMTKKIMLMKIYLLKFTLLHLEERAMEEMVGFLFKIFKSTVLLLFEGVSSLTVNHLFALLVQAVKAGEKFLI